MSLGIIPAAAAGLLIITLLIRIHPSGVSVPPCIVTPEQKQCKLSVLTSFDILLGSESRFSSSGGSSMDNPPLYQIRLNVEMT